MLSDDLIELLTAYVDGELSPRQRDDVMRLLNKSAEAREILRQLQENAHKLKQLRRHKVEPSLVDEILAAIAEERAQRKAPAPKRRQSVVPYVLAVMAASIMVGAIGILTYLAVDSFVHHKQGPPLAVQNEIKADQKQEIEQPQPPEQSLPTPKKINPLVGNIAEAVAGGFIAAPPPERMFAASFNQLRKNGKGTPQLVHEMNLEKSVQLDIVVSKNSDAMTRLRTVLKGQGIKLVADPATNKPVDDKKTEYILYAENMTSNDLAKLVNELSESYVVPFGPNNQKNVNSPFQKVKLTPFAEEEKQKLAKQLGVNAAALERKEGKAETKVERTVVLLPGSATGKTSPQVRQFVNQRRDPPAGAVQVLIKIRQE
jgi:hypothetical protein